VGIDARNHNGDFALALIAKGTGYFSHGKRNRIVGGKASFRTSGLKGTTRPTPVARKMVPSSKA
jgi:hypothetical protein